MFVSINHLTVPEKNAGEVSRRFDDVKSNLVHAPGFHTFRLLKPDTTESRWLVYTEWESKAHYDDWKSSGIFTRMHPHHGTEQPHETAGHGRRSAHPASLAVDAEVITYDVISQFS